MTHITIQWYYLRTRHPHQCQRQLGQALRALSAITPPPKSASVSGHKGWLSLPEVGLPAARRLEVVGPIGKTARCGVPPIVHEIIPSPHAYRQPPLRSPLSALQNARRWLQFMAKCVNIMTLWFWSYCHSLLVRDPLWERSFSPISFDVFSLLRIAGCLCWPSQSKYFSYKPRHIFVPASPNLVHWTISVSLGVALSLPRVN